MSITRHCFPSWSWKDQLLCVFLIFTFWWHAKKIRASKSWRGFDFYYGQFDFLLDLYGVEREPEIQKFTFTIWVRGWIEGIPRMYHANSQVLGCRTRRDIRGQSCPSGDLIIWLMFEPPCSQSGQTFANPLLMKMVSRISFATTVPVSPNSVGMFSGMFRTCMGDKDARASVVHVQFKEQCAVYKGNKSLMLAL